MQVSIIGLGRMGKNIALHLIDQGVSVVGYNRTREKTQEMVGVGMLPAYSLAEIPNKLTEKPVVVILLIPSGPPIDEVLFGIRVKTTRAVEKDYLSDLTQKGLVDLLPQGSVIVDGGNSFYQDSQRRYKNLSANGLHFLDMGTSGGIEGARNGACLMVGGNKEVYRQVEPILSKIAQKNGVKYIGPSGSGHFVKMIHNAIEYGMMAAIAEGLNLVKESEFSIDYGELASLWSHGSIVSGLLMEKTSQVFANDPQLEKIAGEVLYGETEKEIEWLDTLSVPNPVIQTARSERVETRTKPSFIGKVIAGLRQEFGGHAVKKI